VRAVQAPLGKKILHNVQLVDGLTSTAAAPARRFSEEAKYGVDEMRVVGAREAHICAIEGEWVMLARRRRRPKLKGQREPHGPARVC
jgi:hypothetical protein